MTEELPQITACNYGNTSALNYWVGDFPEMSTTAVTPQVARRLQNKYESLPGFLLSAQQIAPANPMSQANTRRIVQVFIADPDPNVPLSEALLWKGEAQFTDLTDQELFFELSIATMLKQHNEKRAKWLDKDATKRSGKDVFLEPTKIRDLRMTVVTIAQFNP